jgi:peptidoglycan L-alanyl-D-glutamate endopeptidase CwlK
MMLAWDVVDAELARYLGSTHTARAAVRRIYGMMDAISEQRLAMVKPELAATIRGIAAELAALQPAIVIRVTAGIRGEAEQTADYAKGRTAPGRIVTRAIWGYSMHGFGLAVDLCPGRMDVEPWEPDYNAAAASYGLMLAACRRAGLNCGADWVSFKDMPHVQVAGCPTTPTWAMRNDLGNGDAAGLRAVWARLDAGMYGT